ncbi:MAG: DUF1549 domain-containing protein, partial [Bacteroidota bacterium]
MPLFRYLILFVLAGMLLACGADLPEEVELAYAKLPDQVDFNQHIRPILSDRCWSCHGPDEETRQAGLRLDTEEGAFAQLASGARAFVPGKPGASEAIARMISNDPELVMPVPESKMTVSAKEIALIAKWVDQGAEWKEHWAFLPITAPAAAPNPTGYPAANSIDHFINERLRQEGLPANERADNERRLRRLYLDLTGLPPSPNDMDAWLANPSEEAYVTIVDTLLATNAHAERLTMEWLDLARYADSHGMHADGWRLAWPYRDWVIQAFKENKPFDEFVREQVAGDLLPDSKQDQLIASAFNRMHPMTAEGGVISEEMRLTYVFDRVNTVATGLLGLTMDCSRCHDHKFDPLSQAEYYGFSAFFNNFNELGMTGDDGNYGPYMLLADQETRQQLNAYEEQLKTLEQERAAVAVKAEDLAQFLAQENTKPPRPDYSLPGEKIKKSKDGNGYRVDQHAWATNGFTLAEDIARGKVLEFDHAFDDLFFDESIGARTATEPFSASLFLKTTKRDSSLTQTILGNAGAKNQAWQGSEFYLDEENRLNVRMIKIMPDDALHVRTQDSLKTNTWYQVAFTYNGSGTAAGLQLYVDGKAPAQHILLDNLRGESYPTNHAPWMKVKARK